MATINLRDFYPHYSTDVMIDVPSHVLLALREAERAEKAHRRRMFRHKAHYSLDCGDGIEQDVLYPPMSPGEILEHKLTMQQLWAALESLSETQQRRVYANYILGITQTEIAEAEGVAKSRVSESIKRGLRNMEKYITNLD